VFCKTEQHFRKITNVSYETITKLNKYLILLKNSQLKFNLVSNKSLEDIWNRHFLDSFQIIKFIGNNKRMLDFGSGAGFPGMVCGICSTNYVYLVDSNKKKVSFLKQIKKKLNLKNVFVYHTRIENFRTKKKFDVICSRAVSSLANLLSYTIDFSNLNTRFIFLKGKKVDKEIIFSKKKWSYNLKCETSITNKEGKILIIKNLKKK
jgi:16S rRNA (guanine527-N7)-methyltransferase